MSNFDFNVPMSLKQKLVYTITLSLCQIIHLAASIWFLFAIWIKPSSARCYSIAMGYDDLGNGTVGNSNKESISAMLGRTLRPLWLVRFVNWIFFHINGEIDHCQSKALADVGVSQ